MRRLLLFYLFLNPVFVFAQDNIVDSLTELLNRHPQQDTARVKLLNQLTYRLLLSGSEKTLSTGDAALQLSQKLNYTPGEIIALERIGSYHQIQGDYAKALETFDIESKVATRTGDSISVGWAFIFKGQIYQRQSNYPLALAYYLQALRIFENAGDEGSAASVTGNIGVLYQDMGEPETALKYYGQGLKIHEKTGNKPEIARFLNNLGGVYKELHFFKQAEAAYKRGLSLSAELDDKHNVALILRNLMDIKAAVKNYPEAFMYGFRSLALYRSIEEQEGIADVFYLIGNSYVSTGKPDSAIFYANQSLMLAKNIGFIRNIHDTYDVLAKAYAMKKNFAKAYQYQQQYIFYKDSLNGLDRKNLMATMKFQHDLDKKQSEIVILTKDKQLKEQEVKRQRTIMYSFLVCLLMIGWLAIVLIRSNRRKQVHNALLESRKEELQSTLTELRSTQAQLIQTEKMASLGELTAGIAHEIQNPLNFVNNFSDVNKELIVEMKEEIDKGNYDEAKLIANDIEGNEEKINHHGKRADAIVKGMLQHSRTSSGQKESTDINKLADEYLRLAYHGLRAKDKNFNVEIKTSFDETIGKINIVPQDIGKVLLNLINNAFYATNEKLKAESSKLNAESSLYFPTVTVVTKKLNDKIEISVADNGNGIPQDIIDKIFQPFFTTKPTGQGTGLGLSLSYDIIKVHGGAIKVETTEREGSKFIIYLPS